MWKPHAVFVTRFPITYFDLTNDSIPYPECLGYPPFEGWFLLNAVCNCVFGLIDRVGVLNVFEVNPIRRTVLSLT